MKKTYLSSLLIGLLTLVGVSQVWADAIPTSAGSTLQNGKTYYVTSNTTITGSTGQSALVVANNATVTIDVAKNCTLTVTGGAASGQNTPGGAGIYLPQSATLYLTGKGSVIATGGKAANGGNGSNGTNAIKGGAGGGTGGAGGAGGAGAGAGIGTTGATGGNGGNGSMGGASVADYYGSSGGNGNNSSSMGTLYIGGTLHITATGGESGDKDGDSGTNGSDYTLPPVRYGGGNGGYKGMRGLMADNIGAGGAGGAGGGGGGAGYLGPDRGGNGSNGSNGTKGGAGTVYQSDRTTPYLVRSNACYNKNDYFNLTENTDNASAISGFSSQTGYAIITRSQFKGGMYNTVCFPFALTATQIESTFGAGYSLQTLTSAEIESNVLTINFSDATTIEAGVPYLIKPASDVTVSEIAHVTVTATAPSNVETDLVTFKGLFSPSDELEAGDQNILFVTANDELQYPNVTGPIYGMRAYLELTLDAVAQTPARCLLNAGGKHTPTAIETPSPSGEGRGEAFKFLEKGQVILLINNEKYNMNGQKL